MTADAPSLAALLAGEIMGVLNPEPEVRYCPELWGRVVGAETI